MQSAGPRIELIRFSLLVVLTVALLSVAFRIHSHPSSSAGRPRGASTPTSSPSATTPVQVLPSSTSRPAATPTSTGQQHPHATGGTGSAGTPAGGQPTLPVTGWDASLKLAAVAFVLIGGGTIAVRAAGPRR